MNKILFLTLFLQIIALPKVEAQFNKKDLLIEWDGGWSLRNVEQHYVLLSNFNIDEQLSTFVTETNASLSTKLSYAFFENLSCGIYYHYSFFLSKKRTQYQRSSTQEIERKIKHSFGVFVKKTNKIFGKFYFSNEFDIAFQRQSYHGIQDFNLSSEDFEFKSNRLNLRLSTSILFMVKKRFGLQIQLAQINSIISNKKSAYNENSFDITFNPAFWRYGVMFVL